MDQELATALQQKIDSKTKPVGSLGRIEDIAKQVGLLQGTVSPIMQHCRLTIFAADHGIAEEGVSAFPQEVTAQMVQNFLAGGAAANVFAKCVDVELRVVDAGTATPVNHPNLNLQRFGAGTANSCSGAAMSAETVEKILIAGGEFGRAGEVQAVCFGEMGIANTASSALVAHKITGLPIDKLVGRGTGLDDAALDHKSKVLLRAANRTGDLSPRAALQQYGGYEIAMMVGAMQGAASTGRLIIVDGFIAGVAALCAVALTPEVRGALIFSHMSEEHGHRAVLEYMKVEPLFDLGMRLGEGTGALLAWPLIKASVAMLNDMASFEGASISGAV